MYILVHILANRRYLCTYLRIGDTCAHTCESEIRAGAFPNPLNNVIRWIWKCSCPPNHKKTDGNFLRGSTASRFHGNNNQATGQQPEHAGRRGERGLGARGCHVHDPLQEGLVSFPVWIPAHSREPTVTGSPPGSPGPSAAAGWPLSGGKTSSAPSASPASSSRPRKPWLWRHAGSTGSGSCSPTPSFPRTKSRSCSCAGSTRPTRQASLFRALLFPHFQNFLALTLRLRSTPCAHAQFFFRTQGRKKGRGCPVRKDQSMLTRRNKTLAAWREEETAHQQESKDEHALKIITTPLPRRCEDCFSAPAPLPTPTAYFLNDQGLCFAPRPL